MGQAPAESYTKHIKHIQAKSHDSKRLLIDKHENTQQCTIISWSEKTALFGFLIIVKGLEHKSAHLCAVSVADCSNRNGAWELNWTLSTCVKYSITLAHEGSVINMHVYAVLRLHSTLRECVCKVSFLLRTYLQQDTLKGM